jgi:hypothetical protein
VRRCGVPRRLIVLRSVFARRSAADAGQSDAEIIAALRSESAGTGSGMSYTRAICACLRAYVFVFGTHGPTRRCAAETDAIFAERGDIIALRDDQLARRADIAARIGACVSRGRLDGGGSG